MLLIMPGGRCSLHYCVQKCTVLYTFFPQDQFGTAMNRFWHISLSDHERETRHKLAISWCCCIENAMLALLEQLVAHLGIFEPKGMSCSRFMIQAHSYLCDRLIIRALQNQNHSIAHEVHPRFSNIRKDPLRTNTLQKLLAKPYNSNGVQLFWGFFWSTLVTFHCACVILCSLND